MECGLPSLHQRRRSVEGANKLYGHVFGVYLYFDVAENVARESLFRPEREREVLVSVWVSIFVLRYCFSRNPPSVTDGYVVGTSVL